jgi:hypothetical protein
MLRTKYEVANRLVELVTEGKAHPRDVIKFETTGYLSTEMMDILRPDLPLTVDLSEPELEPLVQVPFVETDWDL